MRFRFCTLQLWLIFIHSMNCNSWHKELCLNKCTILRSSEVEDLLGIATQNTVCDWVIFSVCSLDEVKNKERHQHRV